MGCLIRNTLLQLSAPERLITVSRIFVPREESFDNVIPSCGSRIICYPFAQSEIKQRNPPFETLDFRRTIKKIKNIEKKKEEIDQYRWK